jgi:hypothetical protein
LVLCLEGSDSLLVALTHGFASPNAPPCSQRELFKALCTESTSWLFPASSQLRCASSMGQTFWLSSNPRW